MEDAITGKTVYYDNDRGSENVLVRAQRALAAARIAPILLILGVSFLLVSCGNEDSSSGGGETTEQTTSTSEGTTSTSPVRGESLTVDLAPSQDSGVSGTATLTDVPGGVEVKVDLQGMLSNSEHPAHVHQGGTCADDRAGNGAPIQYPLLPVIAEQDGTGSRSSQIQGVTLSDLLADTPRYINVHAEPGSEEDNPPGVGISCADLS